MTTAAETTVDALGLLENLARYEPITYGDYQRWFINCNYATIIGEQASEVAP